MPAKKGNVKPKKKVSTPSSTQSTPSSPAAIPPPSPTPTAGSGSSFQFGAPRHPDDMYAFGSAATASSTNENGYPPPPAEPEAPETEEQKNKRAELIKERGNDSFKKGKYGEAVELYTSAIELRSTEAAYFTNRAASYMALKRFRLALTDCQTAATLQKSSPQPKTLLRLARCQIALGQGTFATSTLNMVLGIEPGNTQAKQLQQKVTELNAHLANFQKCKEAADWGMARLALDKCLQAVDGEGAEVPVEWRVWRVQVELGRGNWDAASTAANDAMRLHNTSPEVIALRGLVMFLTNKLPSAMQHAQSALRLDPSLEAAQELRKRVKDVERLKEDGNSAFKSGKLEEALKFYGETLERIGERVEEGKGGQVRATLLSNRATTLVKMNRHQEALVDTDAALLLLPTNYKTLRTRARIYLHGESYDAAIADFKSALEFATEEVDIRALRIELKKAEADLKRSKTKDYYRILGVSRDCSEMDIKKGYRRESLIHHPDKGGDEEKFKLVVEAHNVLSDPQRRSRYDMGEDEDGQSDSSGMHGGMNGMDLSELFAQFHGAGGGFPGGGFSGGRGHGHSHGFSGF